MNTNMDLLSNVLMFAVGAVIGSAVTYKLIKNKYEQFAEEEIESVKKEFGIGVKKSEPEKTEEKVEEKTNKTTSTLHEYDTIIREQRYTKYSNSDSDEEEDERVDRPYVIAPEEFDELDDYESIELTYYSCGTLTDECDNIIEDVDEIVGKDFADHFGDYEEDSVYIRNDALRCDYAIMRDYRRYSEVCDEGY